MTVFATGLGPISPPLPDGAIVGVPLPQDEATVGLYYLQFFPCVFCPNPLGGNYMQERLNVLYAGPKQYEVAGVDIIQFQLQSSQSSQSIYLTTSAIPAATYGGFQIHVAQ